MFPEYYQRTKEGVPKLRNDLDKQFSILVNQAWYELSHVHLKSSHISLTNSLITRSFRVEFALIILANLNFFKIAN